MSSRLLDLLDLNELSYIQSTDASVALNTQQRKFYPEKTEYKSPEVIRFVIQGRQFLDMKKTSVSMVVGLSNTSNFNAGQSFLNFINRVRVIAPNGKDISDVRKANLQAYYSNKLYRSSNWEISVGEPTTRLNAATLPGGDYPIYIPLRLLSPFFDNDQLLPPEITENMIVELYLEKDAITTPDTGVTYSISNPELITQMTLMNDSITKAIHMMSNKQLVYEYEDLVHTEHFSSNASSDIRFHLTHSLTNALEVFTSVRKAAEARADNANSFQGLEVKMHEDESENDQLLYRVGDVFLPQQRILGGTGIYDYLLRNRDIMEDNKVTNFSYNQGDFELDANGVGAIYFSNLRRSKLFNTSGREISNQNSLMLEIKYHNGGTSTNVIADMFCRHVARVVIRKGMIEVER